MCEKPFCPISSAMSATLFHHPLPSFQLSQPKPVNKHTSFPPHADRNDATVYVDTEHAHEFKDISQVKCCDLNSHSGAIMGFAVLDRSHLSSTNNQTQLSRTWMNGKLCRRNLRRRFAVQPVGVSLFTLYLSSVHDQRPRSQLTTEQQTSDMKHCKGLSESVTARGDESTANQRQDRLDWPAADSKLDGS